jgi:hypothetical protein
LFETAAAAAIFCNKIVDVTPLALLAVARGGTKDFAGIMDWNVVAAFHRIAA